MKKIIFTVLCTLFYLNSNAQTKITGTVKDATGFPIPLANVKIKGTTSGTTSDLDGNFLIISKATGEQTIEISNIGNETFTKLITLNGKALVINATLKGGVSNLEEVVLTASTTFRSQKEAPMSISSVKAAEITKLSANSQADILRSVPGITAEGGGGEVAANVFVRGLPSGGQYVFNPLQYDGMPLISAFGLNSSAHDVYARTDIGFKGVEFVRGGSAILYGAGSVAGIINYTSKTGDTDPGNIVNVEWANGGRVKTDFYSGGKLGGKDSDTYYALTGFVRYDEGPINVGLPTKGVQLRGNIKKKFDKGSFTMHGQFIDDNVQFYTGIPLDGDSRERLIGNDGKEVEQLMSSQLANTSFLTPNGNYTSPIGNGVATKGGYFLGDFDYRFDNDLKFKAKARYAKYQHSFALLGGAGDPMTLSDLVNDIDANNTGFTAQYQGGGNTLIDGNTRVVSNNYTDRIRPMTDYSGEASLTKKIELSTTEHNITVGTFLSRTEAEDVNYQYSYLSEFNNDPRLVNLSYTDAVGNNVIYSQGGIYNRAGQTANKYLAQNRSAFYISDEIVMDKWRFDVGFRIESTNGEFMNGNIVESTVYSDPELTSELANVKGADGTFTKGVISATDWAASFAALYKLNDTFNLYANLSKGYFFPQLRNFAPVAGIPETKYDSEKIYQFEVGTKISTSKFSGAIAAYAVLLDDRVKLIQEIDGTGLLIDKSRETQSTQTFGVELNGDLELIENLHLRGTATFQEHELTENLSEDLVNNTTTRTNEGNELARQPNFIGSLGLHYDNSKFDSSFTVNYTGSKFNQDANEVELDAITIARINAGYTFDMENAKTLRLGASIFNLFDSDGVTEGNPRGNSVSGNFFKGRPILPRRFFLTASFNF
ncbi:TonB-dependent receptor [Wenyingzhuangia aestuarii]|uniref:TonB-dependent receptor n=1 Tax=Wenyingzhuangia aestuarii TaxID=1647582 RepID=UPI00143C83E3|nr:TonB-dependent receptor [Wenyingzhuangia aestuarii]NJB83366.1 outer membrane receptor protein involved in Fe transport [Wenyingzhuangia aestuarii]